MKIKSTFPFERQIMGATERELLLRDLMRVAEEYFETERGGVDVTRTQDGYSVCFIFSAKRIKNMRTPQ